jgi:hypothetical protein
MRSWLVLCSWCKVCLSCWYLWAYNWLEVRLQMHRILFTTGSKLWSTILIVTLAVWQLCVARLHAASTGTGLASSNEAAVTYEYTAHSTDIAMLRYIAAP